MMQYPFRTSHAGADMGIANCLSPSLPTFLALSLLVGSLGSTVFAGSPWPRHTIDASSRGADGIRLVDINRDGRPDIVTGWEEGGIIRVYLHPGVVKSRNPWPAVTVGRAKSPEDAVAVDLDADGVMDVVSCHEGGEQTIWIHWGPSKAINKNAGSVNDSVLLAEDQWTSEPIPATAKRSHWMYALPMQIDGRNGIDLVVGSKNEGMVGWLESPADPRDASGWRLHEILPAGWIMTLAAADMDGDGDDDIVVTDRKGQRRGVYWIERSPAVDSGQPNWTRHDLGASGIEVMFADTLIAPGQPAAPEIWVATHNDRIMRFFGTSDTAKWQTEEFSNPFGVGFGKAVAIVELNASRRLIAHTTEAGAFKVGHKLPAVAAAEFHRSPGGDWKLTDWQDVSGLEGVKFDLIRWIDMDQDGDLDLLTCEERDNLGVFWYERQ